MHTAEEVRDVAEIAATGLSCKNIAPMLLAYADLLEAMEEYPIQGPAVPDVIAWLRQRAAEKENNQCIAAIHAKPPSTLRANVQIPPVLGTDAGNLGSMAVADLHPEVLKEIDKLAKWYSDQYMGGLGVRNDLRYIAALAVQLYREELARSLEESGYFKDHRLAAAIRERGKP